MTKREALINIFNDSAAMEGNEPAFLQALEEYEAELRADEREQIAAWLDKGAPVAAKWIRHDYPNGIRKALPVSHHGY